mgnify:CR=1 FL=1
MIDIDMVWFCVLNNEFIFVVTGTTGNNLESTISTGTLDCLTIILIIIIIKIVIIYNVY